MELWMPIHFLHLRDILHPYCMAIGALPRPVGMGHGSYMSALHHKPTIPGLPTCLALYPWFHLFILPQRLPTFIPVVIGIEMFTAFSIVSRIWDIIKSTIQ